MQCKVDGRILVGTSLQRGEIRVKNFIAHLQQKLTANIDRTRGRAICLELWRDRDTSTPRVMQTSFF